MPSSASRSANRAVIMASPALERQYSARLALAGVGADRADVDDHAAASRPRPADLLDHHARHALGEEERPLQVGAPSPRRSWSRLISSRSTRWRGAMPALLTSRSIRPIGSSAALTSRSRSARPAMSAWTASPGRPSLDQRPGVFGGGLALPR